MNNFIPHVPGRDVGTRLIKRYSPDVGHYYYEQKMPAQLHLRSATEQRANRDLLFLSLDCPEMASAVVRTHNYCGK